MQIDNKIYNFKKNQEAVDVIPETARKILDIGCGTGVLRDFLNQKITIHGITISEKEYEIAKNKLDKVFVFNLENGLPENIDKDYDIILASHVFEHIAYPDRLLDDIKKVLIPEGKLIVALPNIMHYKYRFKLISGNFDYEDAGVMDYTHLRWYTFSSAKILLEKSGFIIEKAYVSGELPLYRFSKYLPEKLQLILKKILFGISKGFFGMQMLFILKKRKIYK